MKITKSQLRQIIKEEVSKEIGEGFLDRFRKPAQQSTEYKVTFRDRTGTAVEGPNDFEAPDDDTAIQKAKEMLDDRRSAGFMKWSLENTKTAEVISGNQ